MKFILTIHALTPWNIVKKIQGSTDIDIAPEGERATRDSIPLLHPLSITHVITSNLKRAASTGKIITSALNVPLLSDARLNECRFGSIEGMVASEATPYYRNIHGPTKDERLDCWHLSYTEYDFHPFGGESRDEVLTRLFNFLNEWTEKFPKSAPLVVSHGCILNTLIAHLGKPPTLKRGEYTVIEYNSQASLPRGAALRGD